jgi:hypothetical protein
LIERVDVKPATKDPMTVVIGWREWVTLPSLGINAIKAKIDSGARTSSLHAYDITEFKRGSRNFVRFTVHPQQRTQKAVVSCETRLLEKRKVKDSGGKVTLRPVIITQITLGDKTWEIELTLTNRNEMGFRMLLGRQALRNNFIINPGKSFLASKHIRTKK